MEEYIHQPFMMMLAGAVIWFLWKWSRGRNKGIWNGKGFWHNQKDEIYLTIGVGGFIIIWDDQAINAVVFVLRYAGLMEEETVFSMKDYYYFLLAPIVDIMYKITK